VVKESSSYKELLTSKVNIVILTVVLYIIISIIGFYLAKLFIYPIQNQRKKLNEFIKNTTHELNTPISAIVTNIEMIDTTNMDEKLAKKIKRIDIGAKTVSNIYQDLTYLTLNNQIMSQNEQLNISDILYQRVEYFSTLANVKKIHFEMIIEETEVNTVI
jgi:two-component system OmpR family sensor kinase